MEEEAAQLGGAAESLTGLEVGGGESWGRTPSSQDSWFNPHPA